MQVAFPILYYFCSFNLFVSRDLRFDWRGSFLTKKMAHDNEDDNAAAAAPPNARDGGHDGANSPEQGRLDVQAVATMYDNMADEYLQMMQADAKNEAAIGPTRAALQKLCETATANAPQQGTLVDVGCGPGTNLLWLVQESSSAAVDLLASYSALIGIDLSPAMIHLAQKEALSQGLPQQRISFRVGNMLDLDSISSSSVAAMCNLCCIQHVNAEGLRNTLSEACRVLLPGGLLLLQFWTGEDAPLPGPAQDGAAAFIGWKPETVGAILADATQGRLMVEEQSRHVYPEFDMPYAFFYIRKK